MRLFLAITPPKQVSEDLHSSVKSLQELTGVRWVPRTNYHITLKFFGQVENTTTKELSSYLEGVIAAAPHMRFKLAKPATFKMQTNLQIFHMGLEGDVLAALTLIEAIEKSLKPFGFPKQSRSFKPHLTLGRGKILSQKEKTINISDQFCKLLQTYQSEVFDIQDVHLYQSQLSSTGARYIKIKSFPLRDS